MNRSVFVIDTPKDCLHCKMRRVIYCEKSDKGYQNCGLNHDGYKLESFFEEEDLREGWISPKCPLVSEEDFIYESDIYDEVTDLSYIATHYDIDAIYEARRCADEEDSEV